MTPSATPMLTDNTGQVDASETVRFGVDGCAYEIDLTARRARELRSMAGRYISAARQIPPARSQARRQQPRPRVPMDREQPSGSDAVHTAGDEHGLTAGEQQELRAIVGAAKPQRSIVAGRLRTKGLVDRDTAGNWWLTDAGRRELRSA
jgi:hypothetical protein